MVTSRAFARENDVAFDGPVAAAHALLGLGIVRQSTLAQLALHARKPGAEYSLSMDHTDISRPSADGPNFSAIGFALGQHELGAQPRILIQSPFCSPVRALSCESLTNAIHACAQQLNTRPHAVRQDSPTPCLPRCLIVLSFGPAARNMCRVPTDSSAQCQWEQQLESALSVLPGSISRSTWLVAVELLFDNRLTLILSV